MISKESRPVRRGVVGKVPVSFRHMVTRWPPTRPPFRTDLSGSLAKSMRLGRIRHNRYPVSTSLAQTHLHQPHARHSSPIGHLP
jgi:hypothetical protein